MTSFFSSLFSCKWNSKLCAWPWVACVASVSVWFRSKKRPWKGIFGFDRARNETRTKKWKRGEGEGKEGTPYDSIKCRCVNRQAWQAKWAVFKIEGFMVVYLQAFPPFLPHPLPALLLAPFFARSLTLFPRSFLLNRTETHATQASLAMGSLRGRCKKGRGRGEGEKPSLSPDPLPFSLPPCRLPVSTQASHQGGLFKAGLR